MSVITYLRTYVASEFKISYGRLGPTESRVVAVLLNTTAYFLGVQTISTGGVTLSPYDLPLLPLAMLLFAFFINTAVKETRRLVALGE